MKKIIARIIIGCIWMFNIYIFYDIGWPNILYAILIVVGLIALFILLAWLQKEDEPDHNINGNGYNSN